MYSCAINKDIENAKGMRLRFNSLELDILQSGYDLDETDFSARLEEMKNSFSTQKLESQLEEMKRIKITMIAVVNDIFANF